MSLDGHALGAVAVRSAGAIAVLACALALPAAPALAQAGGDGFTGFEKKITAVTAGGEPEIAVGTHGTPLLVAFNGCGIAVSHDRGATFAVAGKSPADPGPTPGDPYHYCSDPVAALGPRKTLYAGA
ncbi:MAG: BNR/Asp-box repeat protein, partial [Solirubrobacterales bacterium]|nr:BNR/Asp-box repeat protein [Solirubrobacterales bacterium]